MLDDKSLIEDVLENGQNLRLKFEFNPNFYNFEFFKQIIKKLQQKNAFQKLEEVVKSKDDKNYDTLKLQNDLHCLQYQTK